MCKPILNLNTCIVCLFTLFTLLAVDMPELMAQRCATNEVHRHRINVDSCYRLRYEALQQMPPEALILRAGADTTFEIPVVVHVLYNTPEQNISEEQIQSQLDVLNEDYSALNESILDVPPDWQGLLKDSKIRFKLAQRDPLGNFSTGITRTATTFTEFNLLDPAIFADSLGGKDAWPNTRYLNIWVCSLQGNALGFASFPGSSSDQDGVVINHRAFGRIGTTTSPYNRGRTCTHEVGHWLNLIHIWGDDNNDCSGKDFPFGQQQLDDTPNQAAPNFRCPSFPKTDDCTVNPPGIMFMNYMDYTDDRCMMFFTPGQIRRMRLITDGIRDTLKSSQGAILPALLNNDLAIDSILNPVKRAATRCLQPQVRLRNNGVDTVKACSIVYNVSGGLSKTFRWNGSIPPGETTIVTLPEIGLGIGSQVMEFRLNGVDQNTVNNYRSSGCRVDGASEQNCESSSLLLYPNPLAGGRFLCIRTRGVPSEKVSVQIFNSLGQELFLQQLVLNPGDALQVDMQGYASGIYYVQAEGEEYRSTARFLFLPEKENNQGAAPDCN